MNMFKNENYLLILVCLCVFSSLSFALTTQQKAVWSYAAFGTGIGASGINVAKVQNKLELYLGGSTGTFGGNGYWYTLRWNETSKAFEMNYVSQFYNNGLSAIRLGNTINNGTNEIVVAEQNGFVNTYTQINKILLRRFKLSTESITSLELKDINNDGLAEIIAIGSNGLAIYSGIGKKIWEMQGTSGTSLTVGQMDNDTSYEIALNDGSVIDIATKTVQWKRSRDFGNILQSADIDNDGKDELITAEAWQFVWAFDVDRKLPKWSVSTPQDIGAIKVVDMDSDGVKELLVGDGQWGSVYAIDTQTQQKKWTIANPEHGVTNIAIGDVNNDGVNEVFFGAGFSSTGSDFLYVGNWQTESITWQNTHLDGPFIKPAVGDVDNDGKLDLVTATFSSNAGYSSGRILVFDAYTLTLKGISEPVANGFNWSGIHDIKIRNITNHPGKEIIIATDYIEAFSFKNGVFKIVWENAASSSGSPSYSVDIADLNNDGKRELIVGGGRADTGASGVFVYVYDVAKRNEVWHSFQIGDYWGNISHIMLGDFDKDGDLDFGGKANGGELALFDGRSKEAIGLLATTGKSIQQMPSPRKLSPYLITENQIGGLDYYRYQPTSDSFDIVSNISVEQSEISGFRLRTPSDIWYGFNGMFKNADLKKQTALTQSLNYGDGLGKDIVFLNGTKYGDLAITTSTYGIFGFPMPKIK